MRARLQIEVEGTLIDEAALPRNRPIVLDEQIGQGQRPHEPPTEAGAR